MIVNISGKIRCSWWCALLALVVTAPAVVAETRQHDAHEHGKGLLAIAVDGDALLIELEVPAVNVVGFEHTPRTDEQHRLVDEAVAALRQAEKLFVPSVSAQCAAEQVTVALFGEDTQHDEHHDHGAESADAHAAHEDEGTHSELHAQYYFHCANAERLQDIVVNVFEHLRDVQELVVQAITASSQMAFEITPRSRKVAFNN